MVEWLKYTTSLASPTLAEYGISDFMDSGRFQPYLRKIRREYARRMSAISQSVRRFFPAETRLTRPKGGFVLWVELPESVDALEVYYRALEAGIAITPGHLFSASDQYQHFIRLNAANWSPDIDGHIKQLGQFISSDKKS
jgi:DNA-binding transcriptional MocR family regulator